MPKSFFTWDEPVKCRGTVSPRSEEDNVVVKTTHVQFPGSTGWVALEHTKFITLSYEDAQKAIKEGRVEVD